MPTSAMKRLVAQGGLSPLLKHSRKLKKSIQKIFYKRFQQHANHFDTITHLITVYQNRLLSLGDNLTRDSSEVEQLSRISNTLNLIESHQDDAFSLQIFNLRLQNQQSYLHQLEQMRFNYKVSQRVYLQKKLSILERKLSNLQKMFRNLGRKMRKTINARNYFILRKRYTIQDLVMNNMVYEKIHVDVQQVQQNIEYIDIKEQSERSYVLNNVVCENSDLNNSFQSQMQQVQFMQHSPNSSDMEISVDRHQVKTEEVPYYQETYTADNILEADECFVGDVRVRQVDIRQDYETMCENIQDEIFKFELYDRVYDGFYGTLDTVQEDMNLYTLNFHTRQQTYSTYLQDINCYYQQISNQQIGGRVFRGEVFYQGLRIVPFQSMNRVYNKMIVDIFESIEPYPITRFKSRLTYVVNQCRRQLILMDIETYESEYDAFVNFISNFVYARFTMVISQDAHLLDQSILTYLNNVKAYLKICFNSFFRFGEFAYLRYEFLENIERLNEITVGGHLDTDDMDDFFDEDEPIAALPIPQELPPAQAPIPVAQEEFLPELVQQDLEQVLSDFEQEEIVSEIQEQVQIFQEEQIQEIVQPQIQHEQIPGEQPQVQVIGVQNYQPVPQGVIDLYFAEYSENESIHI